MKKLNKNQECKYCGYKWKSVKETPKQCPACKRYFIDKLDRGEK